MQSIISHLSSVAITFVQCIPADSFLNSENPHGNRKKISAVSVYVTTSSIEVARTIAKTIVTEQLAACANIFPAIESWYLWEGVVCNDPESALIFKSQKRLVTKLIARIKSLHSYSIPCIVSYPIDKGNPEFIQWIGASTEKSARTRHRRPTKK
jgi:periplasmic divalent cation tolerance protein